VKPSESVRFVAGRPGFPVALMRGLLLSAGRYVWLGHRSSSRSSSVAAAAASSVLSTSVAAASYGPPLQRV
jgi:hypothetical protein